MRTETLGLAQILVENDAAIVAVATADRGYDEDLARTVVSRSLEVNVREPLADIRVTTLAITGRLATGATTCERTCHRRDEHFDDTRISEIGSQRSTSSCSFATFRKKIPAWDFPLCDYIIYKILSSILNILFLLNL